MDMGLVTGSVGDGQIAWPCHVHGDKEPDDDRAIEPN